MLNRLQITMLHSSPLSKIEALGWEVFENSPAKGFLRLVNWSLDAECIEIVVDTSKDIAKQVSDIVDKFDCYDHAWDIWYRVTSQPELYPGVTWYLPDLIEDARKIKRILKKLSEICT